MYTSASLQLSESQSLRDSRVQPESPRHQNSRKFHTAASQLLKGLSDTFLFVSHGSGHKLDGVLIPRAGALGYVVDLAPTVDERGCVALDPFSVLLVLWGLFDLQPVIAGHGMDIQISRAMPRATMNASAR